MLFDEANLTREETEARISEIRNTSILYVERYKMDDLEREMIRLKSHLQRLNEIDGIYLIANPDVDRKGGYFSKEGLPTWYSGADYERLVHFLPERHRGEGCYGIHTWLSEIGALTAETHHDHEYSMLCYYFKSEEDMVEHIDKINSTLKELKDKGGI